MAIDIGTVDDSKGQENHDGTMIIYGYHKTLTDLFSRIKVDPPNRVRLKNAPVNNPATYTGDVDSTVFLGGPTGTADILCTIYVPVIGEAPIDYVGYLHGRVELEDESSSQEL